MDADKLNENEQNRLINTDLEDEMTEDEELKQAFMQLLLTTAHENINTPIKVPDICKAIVNESTGDNNSVLSFINQHYDITNNDKDRIKTSDFHADFTLTTRSAMTPKKIKESMIFNHMTIKNILV